MAKYRVKYYYSASGMEGHVDERDYGLFEANSEEEAIEAAIIKEYPTDVMYGPNNSYSTRDFVRGCMLAAVKSED